MTASSSPASSWASNVRRPAWRRSKRRAILAGQIILLLGTSVASLGLGAARITHLQVIGALQSWISGSETGAGVTYDIITSLRLPRVLLSAIVGSSLSVAGMSFQALLRNPLADPYVIGASAGASFGAVLAMVLGLDFAIAGIQAVPVMAFVGALGAVILVYQFARIGNRMSGLTLLLAGIAVGSVLSAMVSLSMYLSGHQLHRIVYWLMGGFSAAAWSQIKLILPYFALGMAVTFSCTKELNVLLLGEETAQSVGVDVGASRKWILGAASLLTASAVAVSGIIGFVGLVVPHIMRSIVGPDHAYLLPASALGGAVLLVVADAFARTVISPVELPVGLVTALLGGPFFLYILAKGGYRAR